MPRHTKVAIAVPKVSVNDDLPKEIKDGLRKFASIDFCICKRLMGADIRVDSTSSDILSVVARDLGDLYGDSLYDSTISISRIKDMEYNYVDDRNEQRQRTVIVYSSTHKFIINIANKIVKVRPGYLCYMSNPVIRKGFSIKASDVLSTRVNIILIIIEPTISDNNP